MESGIVLGGKYRLQHELGQGSMGAVWAGVHEVLGRPVAIKVLQTSFEDPETAHARFIAEAKAAARIKHRFVVDVFDFGTEDGLAYMVQELLEGRSLGQCMYEGPAWSVRDVVRFSMQCLAGLEAVHERGIAHRDLKPENIFVVREGEERIPKLLDFGISKQVGGSDISLYRPSVRTGRMKPLTAVGATLGTPAYMSPEQLCNMESLDGRADLYSLGVIMYEWLTGSCPYPPSSNYAELNYAIQRKKMKPLRQVRPDLAQPLCDVIERALEPERDARFASAAKMQQALNALVASAPTGALSIVQGPDAAAPLMCAETVRLLEAATDPFASERPPQNLRWKRHVLTGALCAAAVATIYAVLPASRHAPRQGAHHQVPASASVRTISTRATEPTHTAAQEVATAKLSADALPSADPLPTGADLPADTNFARTTATEPSSAPEPVAKRHKLRVRAEPAQPSTRPEIESSPPPPAAASGASSITPVARLTSEKVVRVLDF